MKFWCDDYDTYAAETLDDVRVEQEASGLGADYWDAEAWNECSGSKQVWVTPFDEIDDLDKKRVVDEPEYRETFRKIHCKSLDEIFNNPELRPVSTTGKAWYMSTTEH